MQEVVPDVVRVLARVSAPDVVRVLALVAAQALVPAVVAPDEEVEVPVPALEQGEVLRDVSALELDAKQEPVLLAVTEAALLRGVVPARVEQKERTVVPVHRYLLASLAA